MNLKLFLLIPIIMVHIVATSQDTKDNRDKKWREDLLYLKERFPAYDKTLTPVLFTNSADSNKLYYAIQKNSLDAFFNGVDSLYKIADKLSDEQIMISMCKLIALSPNAHTRLYLFRVRTILNNLPIGIFWFDEKLYITAAPKIYSYLLGAQITAINGITIDSVKKRVDELISGNRGWKDYMSLYFLRSPQVIKGLSLGNEKDKLNLIVVHTNGKTQMIEMKADFVPQSATLEAWKDLSPVTIKTDSLVHALESRRLPLYLKHADKDYHYQYLQKELLVYLQFNRTQNMKNISFHDYIAQMIEAIKHKPYQKFVLDLRFNTGGDNSIAANALLDLAMHVKNKKVYIITDGITFSAGVTTAALFKSLTGAKIIGEPAGDGLIYLSEGGNVVLPHSKLNAHYANGLHNDQYYKDFTIAPDKKILVTIADYLKGEDPILNYIINDK